MIHEEQDEEGGEDEEEEEEEEAPVKRHKTARELARQKAAECVAASKTAALNFAKDNLEWPSLEVQPVAVPRNT